MLEISVRSAAEADLDAVLGLYRQLSPHHPVADPEHAPAIWRGLLARPGVRVFVAEHYRHLVSTCTLVVVPNLTQGGRPYALVENVATRGDLSRRG